MQPPVESTDKETDDGISPVVGAILMVAITVILAAIILFFITGLADQPTAATAGFTTTSTPDGLQITLNNVGTAESIQLTTGGTILHTWEKTDVGTSVTVTGVDPNTELTLIGTVGDSATVIQAITPEQTYGTGPPALHTPGPTVPTIPVVTQTVGVTPEVTSQASSSSYLTGATSADWTSPGVAHLFAQDLDVAIDQEHVYLASSDFVGLNVLNVSDGGSDWSNSSVGSFEDRPLALTDTAVVSADNSGTVVGTNKTDGSELWRLSSYTLVEASDIYVEGPNQIGFATNSDEYITVDTTDGSVVDTQSFSSRVFRVAESSGTTFYLTEEEVIAHDSAGNELWTYTHGGSVGSDSEPSDSFIGANGGQVFVIAQFANPSYNDAPQHHLQVLDSSTGTLQWTSNDVTGHHSVGSVKTNQHVKIGPNYVYARMDLDDDTYNTVDEYVAFDRSTGAISHTFASGEFVRLVEADGDILVSDGSTITTVTPGTWSTGSSYTAPGYISGAIPGDGDTLYVVYSSGMFGERGVVKLTN